MIMDRHYCMACYVPGVWRFGALPSNENDSVLFLGFLLDGIMTDMYIDSLVFFGTHTICIVFDLTLASMHAHRMYICIVLKTNIHLIASKNAAVHSHTFIRGLLGDLACRSSSVMVRCS